MQTVQQTRITKINRTERKYIKILIEKKKNKKLNWKTKNTEITNYIRKTS